MSDWLETTKREKKRHPLFNLLRILIGMILLFSIGLSIGYFFHQGNKFKVNQQNAQTIQQDQAQPLSLAQTPIRSDYLGEPSFDLDLPYEAKKQISTNPRLIPTQEQSPELSIPNIQAQAEVPPIPNLKENTNLQVKNHQNHQLDLSLAIEPVTVTATETIEILDEKSSQLINRSKIIRSYPLRFSVN